MNICSLHHLIISICYLNALEFTSISRFSCFICLDDRIILICDSMIYSFIRAFAGTYANYLAMAHRNRNFQYYVLHKMNI